MLGYYGQARNNQAAEKEQILNNQMGLLSTRL